MTLTIQEIIAKAKRSKSAPDSQDFQVLIMEVIKNFVASHKAELEAVMKENVKGVAKEIGPALMRELKAEIIAAMPDVQDGHTPTNDELLALIEPLIPEVQDGKDADEEAIINRVLRLLPDPKDGHTPTDKELRALIQPIATSLVNESERRIMKAIREMTRQSKDLAKTKEKRPAVMRGGGDIVNIYDLSSQTNGVLKTFTVPKHRKALVVMGSDFPSVLFENNGFTLDSTRTQLTLSVTNAPSQGSQLAFQYVN